MKSFLIKFKKSILVWKKNGFWNGTKIIFNYLLIFLKSFFVLSGDVLFISGGVGDSAHYRAYNPAEELRVHGFKALTTNTSNPFLFKLVDKFKIFVFHRVVYENKIKKIIEKIKKQNKEIIFDTDDLIHDPQYLVYMDYFKKMSSLEQEQYKKGIGSEIINDPYVKVCTTTVSYLAEKLSEKNKRVIIVPNKISRLEIKIANKILGNPKKNDGFVRIGYYSGTLSHDKDFASITNALLAVLEKYKNTKLLLAGPLNIESSLNKFSDRIEIIPKVARNKYYENVYKCDINLAPLEKNNPFCESKSPLKFIEAGILKIPTVAIRNQTFSETIHDEVDGFLADGDAEWEEKISRLIENEDLRKTLGEKARDKVLNKYNNSNSQNKEYYEFIKDKL